jgi:hypothetical protein
LTDRAEFAAIGSSIVGAVGAVAAWISGYQILVVILSGFLVAMLTFEFNARMQKRAWKRETAVKFVSELYGPLYLDVSTVLQTYSRLDKLVWGNYGSSKWGDVRKSFYYLIIDPSLLKELEGFYALLDQTSKKARGLIQLADDSLLSATRRKLGADIQTVTWTVTAFKDGISQGNLSVNALEAVIDQTDLMSLVERDYRRYSEYVIKAGVQKRGSNEVPTLEIKPEIVKEIFIEAGRSLKESHEFKDLKVDYDDLMTQGEKVRAALASVVKAPWNL